LEEQQYRSDRQKTSRRRYPGGGRNLIWVIRQRSLVEGRKELSKLRRKLNKDTQVKYTAKEISEMLGVNIPTIRFDITFHPEWFGGKKNIRRQKDTVRYRVSGFPMFIRGKIKVTKSGVRCFLDELERRLVKRMSKIDGKGERSNRKEQTNEVESRLRRLGVKE